jgi:hypothetical protein
MPRTVRDVLAQSGDALPVAAREYFEPRFGFDFANVRVHADSAAAHAADALHARAFTAGSHIAFAANAFAPGTQSGGLLLAHELAHVAQGGTAVQCKKDETRDAAAMTAAPARRGSRRGRAQRRRERSVQDLQKLARQPAAAHSAWRRLELAQQIVVYEQMVALFGAQFAERFRVLAAAKQRPQSVDHTTNVSGTDTTALAARGYVFSGYSHGAARDTWLQIWLHPSGSTFRIVSRSVTGGGTPAAPAVAMQPAPSPEPAAEAAPELEEQEAEAPAPTSEWNAKQRAMWHLLKRFEANIEALEELCYADPYQPAAAERKSLDLVVDKSALSQQYAKDFPQDPEGFVRGERLMHSVDPGFWDRDRRARDELNRVREACVAEHPDFNPTDSVVGSVENGDLGLLPKASTVAPTEESTEEPTEE